MNDLTKVTDAQWLEQVSQWHDMYYHDLEVMSSIVEWTWGA